MEALEIDRTDTNQYPCVFGRYKSDGTWCFELCFLNLNKRLRCNLGLETRIVKSNCLFSIGCFHWLVCNHLGDEVWKFSHIVQSFKWKIKIFLLFIYFFIFFIFGIVPFLYILYGGYTSIVPSTLGIFYFHF